jgi:hypothetical protein
LSPGALDRLREKRGREQARAGKTRVRVALMGIPILLLVVGFFAYRYYIVHTTIAELRRIVAEARDYNAPTKVALERAFATKADGCPAELLSRLGHSSQIAQALGSVLEKEGRPPSRSSPTALPDIDLRRFDAEASSQNGYIWRDGTVITSLIARQCDSIEDRLNTSEAFVAECVLAGDIVLLRGARGLVERWDLLEARREVESSDASPE